MSGCSKHRSSASPQRGIAVAAPARGVNRSIGAPTYASPRVRGALFSGVDQILLGESLELLPRFADESFQLIYIDPPFNTGRVQSRRTLRTVADLHGDRTGFQGRRYRTKLLAESSYRDTFEDYLGFLAPRLEHAHRLLAGEGTLYLHVD